MSVGGQSASGGTEGGGASGGIGGGMMGANGDGGGSCGGASALSGSASYTTPSASSGPQCVSQGSSARGLTSLSAYVASRLVSVSHTETGAKLLQIKIIRLLQHCPHLLLHIFEMVEIHALTPSASKDWMRLNAFFVNFFSHLPDDLSAFRFHGPSFIVIKMLLQSVRGKVIKIYEHAVT